MRGISALYILDKKGKILVTRAYRNDVPHYINDKFNQKIIEFDENSMEPLFMHGGFCFIFTKQSTANLACAARKQNMQICVSDHTRRSVGNLTGNPSAVRTIMTACFS